MAEIKTEREHEGQNVVSQMIKNESVNVGTSQTKVISPIDMRLYNNCSIVTYNGGTGGTLTLKVWVNNKDDIDTDGAINYANGWAQLGSDITISAGNCVAKEWTGTYRWLAVTGALGTSTASDINTYILLTHQ